MSSVRFASLLPGLVLLATTTLTRAAPALPPVPDSLRRALHTAAVLVRAARAYDETGDTLAPACARAAARLARASPDSLTLGRALEIIGSYQAYGQELTAARRTLTRAERLLDAPGATWVDQARVWQQLGNLYAYLHYEAPARRYFRRALGAWRRVGDRRAEASCLNSYGLLYQQLQRPDSTTHYLLASLRLCEALRDTAAQAVLLANVSGLYQQLGRPLDGLRYCHRALTLLPAADLGARAELEGQYAALLWDAAPDSLPAALGRARRAIRLMSQAGRPADLAHLFANLASLHAHGGGADSAAHYNRRALDLSRRYTGPTSRATGLALTAVADDLLRALRWADADAYARQALALSEFTDPRYLLDALAVRRAVALARADSGLALRLERRIRAVEQRRDSSAASRQMAEVRAAFEVEQAEREALEARQNAELAELRRQRQQTLAAGGAVGLLLIGSAGGLVYRRRQRRRQQMLTAELRAQIAADLHDDVGALLTRVSLESALLSRRFYPPDQQPERLATLAANAQQAVRQMRDVVWSLAPAESLTLPDTADRLRDHALEYLPGAHLHLDFRAAPAALARRLAPAAYPQLYLIGKEALHNALKHARQATTFRIHLEAEPTALRVTFADDGLPAPLPPPEARGHGLANMAQRAAAVGGTIAFEPGARGLAVVLRLPWAG